MNIIPSDACTDDEFLPPGVPRLRGPHARRREEVKASSRTRTPRNATSSSTSFVDLPEFADFLGPQVGGRASLQPQDDSTEGLARLPGVAREELPEDMPMDEMVREIITSSATRSTTRRPTITACQGRHEPRRDDAQLFLGVRMQCASATNHPFEKWTQDDYYGMAAWFAG